MWSPIELRLNNFISHKKSTFVFKNQTAVMILGENLDDDSQESNGSGKSGIIEGSVFALTGESFRKVRAIDLIMNDEPLAEVSLSLYNSQTKQNLLITRCLKQKTSSTVSVKINDEPIIKTNVDEYNKFIIELLDISKDDLTNYFIISKEKYQSFLFSGDVRKKEIISRFSNSNLIDGVDKIVDKDIDTFVTKIDTLEKQKSKVDGKIYVYEEQLLNIKTKEKFEIEITEKTNSLKTEIKQKNEEIDSAQIDILTFESSVEDIEKQIKKIGSVDSLKSKMIEFENNESKLLKLKKDLKSESNELDELISETNKNLLGIVECPKCEHEFNVSNPDFNVKEGREVVDELKQELEKNSTKISKNNSEIKKIDELKSDIQKQIREVEQKIHSLKMSIKSYNSEIDEKQKLILRRQSDIEKINVSIKNLSELKYESPVNQIKEDIKDCKDEINQIEKQISELNESKQYLTEWIYTFKRFRTHLTNKSVKSIESFTNMFLNKIKTNLTVKMDGYKLLSDGKTLRENISIDILRNGLVEGPIDKFSGGEKVRVDICNILALQKLINLNAKSGGLDMLLLDEIIESVDSVGVTEILNQLNSINQSICIITHANTIKGYNNVCNVVKQNGYSKIFQA